MALLILGLLSFSKENLRAIYSRPPTQWPAPDITKGVVWAELGSLPESPLGTPTDSQQAVIALGKALFFEPRLSASGKISCASCHQPELHWTDGKERSVGHAGAITKRNAPGIANTWFYKRLFWDGRARDLQDQAFGPLISESEMAGEMPVILHTLRKIPGYSSLFTKAYGDPAITPDRLTGAIALFEKSVVSRKSRFDDFLSGNQKALSREELRGLHLFRTKARCMNCHNGPLFTDNQFHNNGFNTDGIQKDAGYYNVSHRDEDSGKFKTPSLRDVQFTGPWMHNGRMKSLEEVIAHYNKGAAGKEAADPLVRNLFLTSREQRDLLAFLKAISAPPAPFQQPVLPD